MTGLSAELLARIQFAFTISFHIIFPAFSIGLASYLTVLNALWLWTKDAVYLELFSYWKKIFAVTFGMGVVSGIVLSYEFGTNWSEFSFKTGPVLGPLMTYEVMSAFFLEAGFLGIMLFGEHRVSKGVHMFATAAVAAGTLLSATWILSANSWMHTPAGFAMNEAGQFVPENWLEIIFNPSFPYRLVHMVLAAYLATAFVIGGTAAWHLLNNSSNAGVRLMFSMAIGMVALATPLQIAAGDLHGLNTLKHQPAKVMAMEGRYESAPDGGPLILFGIPDSEEKRVDYALEIPKLASLILKHNPNAPLSGLDTVADDEEPPVSVVFWSFRIMVGIGLAMLAIAIWGVILRYRGTLFNSRRFHRAVLVMAPSGFIAIIAGWVTTEVGRQPYTVYGLMRTSESLSPIDAPAIGASLIAFVVVYSFVFGIGIFYLIRLMGRLPGEHSSDQPSGNSLPPGSAAVTSTATKKAPGK